MPISKREHLLKKLPIPNLFSKLQHQFIKPGILILALEHNRCIKNRSLETKEFTLVDCKTMFHMVKVFFVSILAQSTKDNSIMEHVMDLENMCTLIMLSILGILPTTKQMEKENMKVLKGIRMKENGNLTFLMEKVEQDTQMDSLTMEK
jgi:hypothetical protein